MILESWWDWIGGVATDLASAGVCCVFVLMARELPRWAIDTHPERNNALLPLPLSPLGDDFFASTNATPINFQAVESI